MRIGINSYFFKFPATGCGQYLSHLLDALAEIDQENEYVLLGPEPLTPEQIEQIPFPYQAASLPNITTRNKSIAKLVWEQYTAPRAAYKANVDLFHVPYFAPPLISRIPTVITIHDVIPLRLPVYRTGAKTKAYTALIARAAHSANLIITVSQHAKQDIIDTLHIPAERIHVTYEAAGEEYYPIVDTSTLAAVRRRYGLAERYILYLGGLDQRKNVLQLVRAFAHLHKLVGDPQLQLLIAGNPDKQHGPLFPDPRPVAAELGMTEYITYHFIEEKDKPAIYSGANMFVFPSLYEGFGLTPLEAMSCGAPVICSNRTSLPEVVSDAAITLDPNDIQAMVEAMHNVLSNADLRAELRARSLQRATQFCWQKTATETVAIYKEALVR